MNDQQLYVVSDETCLHFTNDRWAEVACLQSNQEEADATIILHVAHAAAEGHRAVVVTSHDTDVMVLCLALSAVISCPLFQKCGTNNRIRCIDINKLRHGLGDGVCYYLIGMHAYTGCDTVRVFAGHGKLGALKLMRSEHCLEMFCKLGQAWEQSADLFKKLQTFTCNCTHHPREQWILT